MLRAVAGDVHAQVMFREVIERNHGNYLAISLKSDGVGVPSELHADALLSPWQQSLFLSINQLCRHNAPSGYKIAPL